MKALYEAYKDRAIILIVYIREAHPARPDQTAEDSGRKVIDGTVFRQPKTYAERRKLAETACMFWDLPIPALVDTMEPSIGLMYQAWPNRLYLIDTEGKIVYHGVKGPHGVNVHEGELQLRELLGITKGELATRPRSVPSAAGERGRLGSRSPARERPADASDGRSEKPWWQADDSGDKPKTPKQ